MNELEVKIVKLEPMRVASFHGFGKQPEDIAWEKLTTWAEAANIKEGDYRIFGFNNPDPSPGSPNYGYDFWITVGPEVEAEGEVSIIDFPGGLYAVTRVKGIEKIHETWKQLVAWMEESSYQHGGHQWLEEHLTPMDTPLEDFMLDLYAPITE